MTTSGKLWTGFGLLTGLLVLSTLSIIIRVQSTEARVQEGAVARERMAAGREIEIHVLGYALAVKAHLLNIDPGAASRAAEEVDVVNQRLQQYERLAVTERERELASAFVGRWDEFRSLGQPLLEALNRQPPPGSMQTFHDKRKDVEKFLEDELVGNAVDTFNTTRLRAVEDVNAVERLAIILLIAGALIAVGASVVVGRGIVNSEARRSAMFDTALDSIIGMDHRGRVTEFNPAAEATFGYRREDVLGGQLAELIIPPELREDHRRGLARYLATGEGPVLGSRIELTAIKADGAEFPVELAITRIGGGGSPQFTAYLRDITERKRAEHAMLRANEDLEKRVIERTAELQEANIALRRSNQELETFASVASHDLQEPLRKIQAFGDRLKQKFAAELGEQGRTYVERMDLAAARMRSLIDSLLTFSRVTTKAEPFVPTNLTRIAAEVVSDLEGRILTDQGGVEIGELPAIDADPTQMTQLFLNLIANGLKFRRPEEPSVVRITGEINGEVCELSFTDNGIGFDEVYLDRIFEVFQRLHGRQEYEGTGMGLAICRKIVERHGGSITATSSLGKGSTFLVTLPVSHKEGNK